MTGTASTCRSCQAPITWAVTAAKRRRVPLDPGGCPAEEDGALLVVTSVTGEVWAYSLRMLAERLAVSEQVSVDRAREIAITRYRAHRSHFATCPNAARHRKAGRS